MKTGTAAADVKEESGGPTFELLPKVREAESQLFSIWSAPDDAIREIVSLLPLAKTQRLCSPGLRVPESRSLSKASAGSTSASTPSGRSRRTRR